MSDSTIITIRAKTMEGVGAVDPEVTVDISEVTPISQPIERIRIADFDTSATFTVRNPDRVPNLAGKCHITRDSTWTRQAFSFSQEQTHRNFMR